MTLVETVFAMSVLLMCAFLVAAAFPVATETRGKADNRSKAVSLAMRELEAVRDAGYESLTTYNSMLNRGIINSGVSTSPYSCSSVTLGSGQSIANSLPAGQGLLAVEEPQPELLRITVTVRWAEKGQTRSVALSTLIAST